MLAPTPPAVATLIGFALNFAGLNAVRMLFWSAVLNGVLAPPLVVLVVLLSSDKEVMGDRINSRMANVLGWICAAAMLLVRLEIFSVLVLFRRAYWRK